jgi:hypothetical protein
VYLTKYSIPHLVNDNLGESCCGSIIVILFHWNKKALEVKGGLCYCVNDHCHVHCALDFEGVLSPSRIG